MIRSVLVSVLQSWGFSTSQARDLGGACRLVVSGGPFDAIICTYDLPDGNAFDLVDWMREQQLAVATIVPYGSQRPLPKHRHNVKMLAKPFDADELRKAIGKAASNGLAGRPRGRRKRSVGTHRR